MPLSERAQRNKVEYTLNYNKAHYKRVPLDLPLDQYNQLKQVASSKGETVNGFIKKAINNRLTNEC